MLFSSLRIGHALFTARSHTRSPASLWAACTIRYKSNTVRDQAHESCETLRSTLVNTKFTMGLLDNLGWPCNSHQKAQLHQLEQKLDWASSKGHPKPKEHVLHDARQLYNSTVQDIEALKVSPMQQLVFDTYLKFCQIPGFGHKLAYSAVYELGVYNLRALLDRRDMCQRWGLAPRLLEDWAQNTRVKWPMPTAGPTRPELLAAGAAFNAYLLFQQIPGLGHCKARRYVFEYHIWSYEELAGDMRVDKSVRNHAAHLSRSYGALISIWSARVPAASSGAAASKV